MPELFVTLGEGRSWRFDSTRFLRRIGWLVTPEIGSESNPIVDDESFHGPYEVGKYYVIRSSNISTSLLLCFNRWTFGWTTDTRSWWKPAVVVRFPWTVCRWTYKGESHKALFGRYEFLAFGFMARRLPYEDKPFKMTRASVDAWNAEVDEPCWPMLVADEC